LNFFRSLDTAIGWDMGGWERQSWCHRAVMGDQNFELRLTSLTF